jgi:hypothetical protein
MFFDPILKYILPDAVTPLQRVAIRPTAIFLAILAVACLLAFGKDTFSILSFYTANLAGIDETDLPKTAAALSGLVLVLLFVVSLICYGLRYWLIWLWSCGWIAAFLPKRRKKAVNKRYLFAMIEGFKQNLDTAAQFKQTLESAYDLLLTRSAVGIGSIANTAAASLQLAANIRAVKSSPLPLKPQRVQYDTAGWMKHALAIAGWSAPAAFVGLANVLLAIVVGIVGWLLELLTRPFDLSSRGLLGVVRRGIDLFVPGNPGYRRRKKAKQLQLRSRLRYLRRELAKLLAYVSTPQAKPKTRSGASAAGAKTQQPDDERLQMEELSIECTMAANIRRVIRSIRCRLIFANSAAIAAAINDPVLATEIDDLIARLKTYVLDQPEIPHSRVQQGHFYPRLRLGFAFERTSLGVGQRALKELEDANYFGSAADRSGQQAKPRSVSKAALDQCAELREEACTAIIGATLAAVACLMIGLLGPWLSLPNGRYLVHWGLFALIPALYLAVQLRNASIAAAKLGSVESMLWQKVFLPKGASQRKLKRILWFKAPWRSQLGMLGLALVVLAVWMIPIGVWAAIFKSDGWRVSYHRFYEIPVVNSDIRPGTTVTENNADLLIRYVPVRIDLTQWRTGVRQQDGGSRPNFPSRASLIDTTFGADCAPLREASSVLEPVLKTNLGRTWRWRELNASLSAALVKTPEIYGPPPPTFYDAGAEALADGTTDEATAAILSHKVAVPDSLAAGATAAAVQAAGAVAASSSVPTQIGCQPYIGWAAGGSVQGGPKTIRLEVRDPEDGKIGSDYEITLPAPAIKFEGNAVSGLLQAEPPVVLFPTPAASGDLRSKPPTISFEQPAPESPLRVKPPIVTFDGIAEPTTLTAKAPSIGFDGTAETLTLTAKSPTINFDGSATVSAMTAAAPQITFDGISETAGLTAKPPVITFDGAAVAPPPTGGGSPPATPPAADNSIKLVIPPDPVPYFTGAATEKVEGISLWFNLYCPTVGKNVANACVSGAEPLNAELNRLAGTSEKAILDFVRRQDRSARFLVLGHADTPREAQFNWDLAEERVAYIANLLHDRGQIAWNRIEGVPLGSFMPWIPQLSPKESQSLNRRVDIYVMGR